MRAHIAETDEADIHGAVSFRILSLVFRPQH
jgi:hypothetical protein